MRANRTFAYICALVLSFVASTAQTRVSFDPSGAVRTNSAGRNGDGMVTDGQDLTMIDYPGATRTVAYGINNSGDIVGNYVSSGVTHGFLLSAGKFTQIDYPGAASTSPYGINSKGDIVGGYNDTAGHSHGFLLSKGKFTQVDYPGVDTTPEGINSAGDIVGMIIPAGKPMAGFLLRGGVWTINDTLLSRESSTMVCDFGINDAGVIVGHWGTRAGGVHGVLYNKGALTLIDYGAGGNTQTVAINNSGDIGGYYYDAAGFGHGFLQRNGRFALIDFPGAIRTLALGVNDSRQVVGVFVDAKGVYHGFTGPVAPAATAPVLRVDDDGVDCPGALRTIQEAVAQAPPAATILVCPGTYRGTVVISGPGRNGLKLIAAGRADEVVLQGDYTERDGFHLENVTSVLIRGFTVRDFGNQPTTATQYGTGNQIYLENAHYNVIENNRLINGDMMGIMLMDSGNNQIQNNLAWANNSSLVNCGIHVQGTKSANNMLVQNFTYGNNMAGIMLSGAGTGNRVANNIVVGNGRYGITNTGTDNTWIEGNRVSYNAGPWGTPNPFAASVKGVGLGINIGSSTGVTVVDNRARSNTGPDINWDGSGQIKFDANACGTSTPAGACTDSGPASPAAVPVRAR